MIHIIAMSYLHIHMYDDDIPFTTYICIQYTHMYTQNSSRWYEKLNRKKKSNKHRSFSHGDVGSVEMYHNTKWKKKIRWNEKVVICYCYTVIVISICMYLSSVFVAFETQIYQTIVWKKTKIFVKIRENISIFIKIQIEIFPVLYFDL